MSPPIEPLLDERDVAEAMKVSPDTVAEWRKTGTVALPFVRVGPRTVRYRRCDVLALIEAGLVPAKA